LPLLLVTTSPATRRLVLKPSFLVKRLLPRREDELLPAVPTLDALIALHHEASEALSPLKTRSPRRASSARGKGVANEELVGTMREGVDRG